MTGTPVHTILTLSDNACDVLQSIHFQRLLILGKITFDQLQNAKNCEELSYIVTELILMNRLDLNQAFNLSYTHQAALNSSVLHAMLNDAQLSLKDFLAYTKIQARIFAPVIFTTEIAVLITNNHITFEQALTLSESQHNKINATTTRLILEGILPLQQVLAENGLSELQTSILDLPKFWNTLQLANKTIQEFLTWNETILTNLSSTQTLTLMHAHGLSFDDAMQVSPEHGRRRLYFEQTSIKHPALANCIPLKKLLEWPERRFRLLLGPAGDESGYYQQRSDTLLNLMDEGIINQHNIDQFENHTLDALHRYCDKFKNIMSKLGKNLTYILHLQHTIFIRPDYDCLIYSLYYEGIMAATPEALQRIQQVIQRSIQESPGQIEQALAAFKPQFYYEKEIIKKSLHHQLITRDQVPTLYQIKTNEFDIDKNLAILLKYRNSINPKDVLGFMQLECNDLALICDGHITMQHLCNLSSPDIKYIHWPRLTSTIKALNKSIPVLLQLSPMARDLLLDHSLEPLIQHYGTAFIDYINPKLFTTTYKDTANYGELIDEIANTLKLPRTMPVDIPNITVSSLAFFQQTTADFNARAMVWMDPRLRGDDTTFFKL